ncbi:MAG: transcription termination factor Rho [Christensenellales bacterium]
MNSITRDVLEELSLKELRSRARDLDVKSPTTLKKSELIDEIMRCIGNLPAEGIKNEPAAEDTKPVRRGRMPKDDNGNVGRNPRVQDAPEKPAADETVKRFPEEAKPEAEEERKVRIPDADRMKWKEHRKVFNNNRKGNSDNNKFQKNQNEEKQVGSVQYGKQTYDGVNQGVASLLESGETEEREGVLEIHPENYGFLRAKNCEPGDRDAYLSATQIKRFGLRKGDYIKGRVKTPQDNKPAAVLLITEINGEPPANVAHRPNFDDLVPIYPEERFKLEIPNQKNDMAIRAIDLVAPIGKGQRAMIVSPPKAGKTTLLKKIAKSIATNYPLVKLFVLLIDERPEEVTDMQRSINGEVVYSTFDELPEHHTRAAELLLARAKRLVEMGKDVVILMDSLTRLARAYNLTIPPTGRTLSGGIDPGALHSPKTFFGSARNIEHGGSLTIIATALVDTGSRMDDVIYEEFKGTGNMEIHLDRKLSEKRIFPAIDLNRSSTRREELLLTQLELEGIWGMRKLLSSGDGQEATENLINMMMKTANNNEFIIQLNNQILIWQKEGYNFTKRS